MSIIFLFSNKRFYAVNVMENVARYTNYQRSVIHILSITG